MADQHRNIESVVNEALRITDNNEREKFLDNACVGDPKLRVHVEKRLAAEGRQVSSTESDETIEAPKRVQNDSSSQVTKASVLSERPGSVIGRYKLLQKIGEGGFGVVYMAEQREPVQRMVALKVIKLGMDTRDVITRFEAERQALALMDHPHIARVLDAGATDTGRPYFVMELVKGVPITEYCDTQHMAVRDRLKLFMQVCGAVQHAHQKGIIHRDLKPSNVLVTLVDNKPVPKVIDFGIAKATQQRLTEHTMFTEFGQFLGTPAYMSPEQADPHYLDIDTRSDIYSLGVLLYEMLTGTTPFDMKTMRTAALDEIKRIIREQDPPRPSTRLSTLGNDLALIAKRRGVEPKSLGSGLRGDLDWIIMRAMEKDRTRRYENATELARDIERHLNQEPVTAGPPSATYRMSKFVRRHRAGVTICAIGIFALFAFATTMGIQAKRIAAERDRANQERSVSDRVVEFQASMLQDIKPQAMGNSMATDLRNRVESALVDSGETESERQRALMSFDSLLQRINLTDAARNVIDLNILVPAVQAAQSQFEDQPEIEARLQHALAATYRALGLSEKGLPCAERALDLRNRRLGSEHRDTLRTLSLKALLLMDIGRNQESGEILSRAMGKWEKTFGPDDRDTMRAKMCLAVLDLDLGLKDRARKAFEELVVNQERVFGPDDGDVGMTLSNLGTVLTNLHRENEAAPILERSLEIRQREFGPDHPHVFSVMQNLATAYLGMGRVDESVQMQLKAIAGLERIRGERHPDSIKALVYLARLYKNQGRYQEAEPVIRRALELHRATLGEAHPSTIEDLTDLGITLGMLDRHKESGPLFLEAYLRSKEVLGPDHSDTMDRLNNLAVHAWYLGEYDKALELFTENLKQLQRKYGEDHVDTTFAMANLAILYTKLGRLEESHAILNKVLEIRTKAYGLEQRLTLETRASLAHLAFEKGEQAEAERLYIELIASQKKILGIDHPLTLLSEYNLGILYRSMDRDTDAEPLFLDTLTRRRSVLGANHDETLDCATELANLYIRQDRMDQARPLLAEVVEVRKAAALTDDASPAQLDDGALILLTCRAQELRDPGLALIFAKRANEATGYTDAEKLTTLARALFDTGDKREAVVTQRMAIDQLPEGSTNRSVYEERLTEYTGQ